MFRIIEKTDTRVFIRSKGDVRIIPVRVLERAKNQTNRIRKPVLIKINGLEFIFKKNQWEKAKLIARDYAKFCSGLPYLYKWESKGRFKKDRKKVIPARSDQ